MSGHEQSQRVTAEALFRFSAEVQSKVMAYDWPRGWEWRMHPGTWIRIKGDSAMAEYITPTGSHDLSAADDLIGSPVVVDGSMPLGAVELRYADQMMLPMGR